MATSSEKSGKRETRTINHALFTYENEDGFQQVAFRGETVDLLPHDVKRGEKFEAFTEQPGDEPPPPRNSILPVYPVNGSEEEQNAWVAAGTEQEILDAVAAEPVIARSVLAAEQRRKRDARKPLLEALAGFEPEEQK